MGTLIFRTVDKSLHYIRAKIGKDEKWAVYKDTSTSEPTISPTLTPSLNPTTVPTKITKTPSQQTNMPTNNTNSPTHLTLIPTQNTNLPTASPIQPPCKSLFYLKEKISWYSHYKLKQFYIKLI